MNIRALVTLWNMTQQMKGTSGARAAIGVLLGLYNGPRFPMDLTDLRVLSGRYQQAAFSVIEADATRCQMEVHQWLNELTGRTDFGMRFEHLAHEYGVFKGRCEEQYLEALDPPSLVIDMPPLEVIE